MDKLVLFKFILVAISLSVIGVLGYFIFLGFMNKDQFLLGLFPLAIVAGLASFFSPCAFPLLPAAVTANLKSNARTNPFFLGLAGAGGVLSFIILLGLVIGIIGQPLGQFLQDNLRIVRGIVGIFLIYLAYRQFSEKSHFGFFEKLAPRTTSPFVYGFSYTLVGSGCTIPILGGLVLGSLASGGFQTAFGSFVVAGAVMSALMFIFMTTASYLKTIPKNILAATPTIKKASGIVLLLVGLFYIGNAIFKFI